METWIFMAQWGGLVLQSRIVKDFDMEKSSVQFRLINLNVSSNNVINQTPLIPVSSLMDLVYILDKTLREAKQYEYANTPAHRD